MATNIPACGIRAYMDGQVHKLLPANRLWHLRQKMFESPGWGYAALGVVALILAVRNYKTGLVVLIERADTLPLVMSSVLDAIIVTGVVSWALIGLSSLPARPPGVWRRYSLKDFVMKQKSGWHLPGVDEFVYRIRKENLYAELEVAVLERPYTGGRIPEVFGIILFQVMGGPSRLLQAEEGGKPIAIFDGKGWMQQFGEAYAPPGSFGAQPA